MRYLFVSLITFLMAGQIAQASPYDSIRAGTQPGTCEITAFDRLDPKKINAKALLIEQINRGCTTVILNSSGGFVKPWLDVADLIHDHKLRVMVPAGGQCKSACTLALFSSPSATVARNADIMIHPTTHTYITATGIPITHGTNSEVNIQIAGFYRERGMPESVISEFLKGKTIYLTPEHLVAMRIKVSP